MSDDWSLTDIEGICAFSWFNSSPKTINSPDNGGCVSRGITNGAPCSAWGVDQTVSDVLGLCVIASAFISGFIVVDDAVDELKVVLDSVSLFAGSDGGIIWACWGGNEFDEHVGPTWVDSIDSGSGGKDVLVGNPN